MKLPSTWVVVTLTCLQDAAMFAFDGESFFNLHLEILHCDSCFFFVVVVEFLFYQKYFICRLCFQNLGIFMNEHKHFLHMNNS